MMGKFTELLYELFVNKSLDLKESLQIISCSKKQKNNVMSKSARYILDEIMKGDSLANSMSKCPYINFDDIYISFINFAEQTGQFKETIEFLKKRCDRKKDVKEKVIEAGVYPTVVVCLAGGGCLYLKVSNLFFIQNKFFIHLGFLFIVSIFIFLCIKKFIGENKLYEAFLAVGFLLKAGINMYDAMNCGAQIVGVTTKFGKLFNQAGSKLLLGMDLEKAFSLGDKYSEAFYYGGKAGGKADIFEKIANWIGEKDEKRRIICLSLIEPFFILVTGGFLIILVVNVFMPYISNLSFI